MRLSKFFRVSFGLVALCVVVASCGRPQHEAVDAGDIRPGVETIITDLGAVELQGILKEGQPVQILDIRTPGEFQSGHIAAAQLIDYYQSDFPSQVAELDRNTPTVVYCASGGRSRSSLNIFKELGFSRILHLADGFNGWKRAGLPADQ